MRTFLELFLLSFALKIFVVAGYAYPLTDLLKEDFSNNNNNRMKSLSTTKNSTAALIRLYTCVYIPSDLDRCDFVSHSKPNENLWNLVHKLSERKKRKLLKNKIYSHSTILETKTILKPKFTKTIIYEIQRCVPSRLPFNLPWCTDEDLSNKNSEIRQLYPFTIGLSKATYEFPTYDYSKRFLTIPKSA